MKYNSTVFRRVIQTTPTICRAVEYLFEHFVSLVNIGPLSPMRMTCKQMIFNYLYFYHTKQFSIVYLIILSNFMIVNYYFLYSETKSVSTDAPRGLVANVSMIRIQSSKMYVCINYLFFYAHIGRSGPFYTNGELYSSRLKNC